jgi:hypothetical protein
MRRSYSDGSLQSYPLHIFLLHVKSILRILDVPFALLCLREVDLVHFAV